MHRPEDRPESQGDDRNHATIRNNGIWRTPWEATTPAGSYSQTCRNVTISLTCQAEKADKTWVAASYDLTDAVDLDLANIDGVLENQGTAKPDGYVPAGSYKNSCKDIAVTLTCEAQTIGKQWVPASFDLTTASKLDLSNIDGVLINRYPAKIYQSTYVGDGNWPHMQKTIVDGKKTPFKYVDILEIAFAEIDASDPDNAFLYYPDGDKPDKERVKTTITEATQQNKHIKIVAQMAWASKLEPLVADKTKAKARLATFAASIPDFLEGYGFVGVDFDWESVPSKMTEELATHLFQKTRAALDAKGTYMMSITPDGKTPTGQALDVKVVNQVFDAVIVQSYDRVDYIDNYVDAKIDPSKLYCGMCSENDGPFYPRNSDISPYTGKLEEYDLPGLYCWRIDNDDTDHTTNVPRYTLTSKMWAFFHGHMPDPPLWP